MAMTEHRKVDTVLDYYRTGNLSEQGVTNLLDRLPVANVTVADQPQFGRSSCGIFGGRIPFTWSSSDERQHPDLQ